MRKVKNIFGSPKVDLTGKRIGRWLVIKQMPKNKIQKITWLCLCDCGTEKTVLGEHLTTAASKSCGCLGKENRKNSTTTHGFSGKKASEYSIWKGMKKRCINKNDSHYMSYGGRGIRVCNRWLNSFENFLTDMGNRPTTHHSIERKDVNGDYCPSNCIWATQYTQSRNKRNSRYIEYNGKNLILSDWAKMFKVNHSVLHQHLKKRTFKEVVEFYEQKNIFIEKD